MDTGKDDRGGKRQGKPKGKKGKNKKRKAPHSDEIDVTTSHDLTAVMQLWRQTYSGVQPREAEGQEGNREHWECH